MTLTLTLAQADKLNKTDKKRKPACQVVLVDENQQAITALVPTLANEVNALITSSQFSGKLAKSALRYATADSDALLLIGVGERDSTKSIQLSGNDLQKIAKTLYSELADLCKTAMIWLGDSLDEIQFGQFALALMNQSYRFDKYKSKASDAPKLSNIALSLEQTDSTDWQSWLDFQQAIYQGQMLARNLANEPPNVCHPAYLAAQAQNLAKTYPDLLTVKVVGEKEMAKLGMNCFLAVSRGSDQEGQLVIMEYNGQTTSHKSTKKSKKSVDATSLTNPIVMLGKGITFDTGGISLKPALGMGEMKFDMGGAAAVLGMIQALCEARLPLQVVGALACAENMPSGRSSRPGDIVTAMNGKTVEILNTDAEGRLVLCDSLVYLQRYQPSVMIDMATLTGAMVVALGSIRTGLFSNDEDVIFELEQASQTAHDRVWHMPLDDDYQEQLNSNMADMQNIGGMPAGSVTAACFLSRFVEDIPWAHLDIAGTAWQSGKEPNGTGRPVPLLMHYLYRQAQQSTQS